MSGTKDKTRTQVDDFDSIAHFGTPVKLYTFNSYLNLDAVPYPRAYLQDALKNARMPDGGIVSEFLTEHSLCIGFMYGYKDADGKPVVGIDLELYRKDSFASDISMLDSLTIENFKLLPREKGIMCDLEAIILGEEAKLRRLAISSDRNYERYLGVNVEDKEAVQGILRTISSTRYD
ncbi:MAG: hypothetical protein KGH60_03285 [Candidatus Micrarchaeota archaeon]|nr:hypothetical protein [Candidatus Micrarchaeota archaeon]